MREKCLLPMLFALIATTFIGCEKGGDSTLDVSSYNKTNILRLRNAYDMYMMTHKYQGPKDEAEFKEYLKGDAAAGVRLKRMGIDVATIDDIFVSERDGKPFKVRYGLTDMADHAIVFEEVGVDGKRLVALAEPKEMGNQEYEGWWTGETKPEMAEDADTGGEDEEVNQKQVDEEK